MERRELYDPEDIEQLLIERAYDDLLEEERAFVLRHLTDRTEYERMRALLLRMHTDEQDAPLDAAPSVRNHVMEAFRAQQRPQWRIWLNSVHAFLLPSEPRDYWRPALAFGSLALVTTLAVVGVGSFDRSSANEMAEVKAKQLPVNAEQPAPKVATAAEPLEELEKTVQQETHGDDVVTGAEAPAATTTTVQSANTDVEDIATEAEQEPAPMEKETAALDIAPLAAPPAEKPEKALFDADKADQEATSFSHVVEPNELARNASVASSTVATDVTVPAAGWATETRAKKALEGKGKGKDLEKTEDVADATALVGLLRAAW
jgi:hypothetical protein